MRRPALVAAAVLLASCGSSAKVASNASAPASPPQSASASSGPDTSGKVSPSPASTAKAAKPTAESDLVTPVITGPDAAVVGSPLPVVPAVDLHTGKVVRLDWLLPGDKPVLIWFWAPH
jgi:hypothetical protein